MPKMQERHAMTPQEAMEMKDEECNRRIAEWEGWYSIHEVPFTDELHIKWTELFGVNPKSREEENIPRYTTSLDACHEAEKKLSDELINRYEQNLRRVHTRDDKDEYWNPHRTIESAWFCATASQRSRALVMTISTDQKQKI